MPKALTQETFIAKAVAKHGNQYDLSKVVYTKANEKIVIGCTEHGDQKVIANDFLQGRGCPECGKSRRSAKRQKKAKVKFERKVALLTEQGKLKMISPEYRGMDEKLTFECSEDGIFQTTPRLFMKNRYGCPECGVRARIANQKEVSLLKLKETLPQRYPELNFDWDSYQGYELPISFECRDHGAGEARVSILDLAASKYGCQKCALEKKGVSKTSGYRASFEELADKKHNGRYSYYMESFVDSRTKMNIGCQDHGVFEQTPAEHLYGKGCPTCGALRAGQEKRELASERFEEVAIAIHGDKYDYSKADYHVSRDKVEIICLDCSEEQGKEVVFWQKPNKHLSGQGCPNCAEYGFDSSKSANLYFFKIKDYEIYKIGITNRTMKQRYQKQEHEIIEPIMEVTYAHGEEALMMEQKIVKKFRKYKYRGVDVLLTAKTSEMFTKNIIEEVQRMVNKSILLEYEQ